MFYIVEIDRFMNDDPEARAIYEYNSHDEALLALYNTMSYAMQNDNIKNILCMIITVDGFTDRREYWEREEN